MMTHNALQYLSDVYASVAPEVKMLRRFTKLNITAGQSVKVQFTLDESDMSFIGIVRYPSSPSFPHGRVRWCVCGGACACAPLRVWRCVP
jgi:hypothetical protein